MKIKTTVTEIECTENELKQSNSLADAFSNLLRGCFNNVNSDCDEEDEEDEETESEETDADSD
jgi:hypothetical protein